MPSNEQILTNNPLLTKAAGEEVTQADEQLIRDYQTMPASLFRSTYGNETADAMNAQAAQLRSSVYDPMIAASRSPIETALDTTKNIATGAVTGIVDTASFATGLLGADTVSRALAQASEGIQNISQSLGSEPEKAQNREYQFKQDALKNRAQREYEEDIANGVSETQALLRREGKAFAGAFTNALKSGNALNIAASGLGSLGSDVVLTGGTNAVAKMLGRAAARSMPMLAKGAKAVLNSSETTQKIAKASPWMLSTGAQEGGSVYTQLLNEGLATSIEDLTANSPEFNQQVSDYIKEGYSLKEAQSLARDDVVKAAAVEAGLKTGAAAMVANYFTRALAKPFERIPNQTYREYVGEALTEPVEESLTEGLGQYATNVATQKHLDENQDLYEDIGSSSAEGAIGGLGIVGARAGAGLTGRGIAKAAQTTGNAVRQGVQRINDIREASDSSEAKANERINTLKNTIKDMEISSETGSEDVVNVINNRLEPTFNEVYQSTTDEETHQKTYSIDPERAVDLQEHIQQDIRQTEATQVPKENSVRIQNVIKGTTQTLNGMSLHLARTLDNRVKAQRQTYQEGVELTPEQLSLESSVLATTAIREGTDSAKKVFTSLPQSVQNQLKSYTSSNSNVQIRLNQIFGESSAKSGSSAHIQEQASSPASEISVRMQTPEEASSHVVLNQDQVNNLSAIKADIPLGDSNDHIRLHSNGVVTYESEGKVYPVQENLSTELNQYLNSQDNEGTINTLQKIANLTAVKKVRIGLPNFEVNLNGETFNGVVQENKVIFSDQTQLNLREEDRLVFTDPNASREAKEQAVLHTIQDAQQEYSRRALELSPEVLERQNKYLENGEVKDYATDEVKKSFNQTFKSSTSKLMVPVRRGMYLWQFDQPLQGFADLLKDPAKTTQYLQMNHLTNASQLVNALYLKDGKQSQEIAPKRVIDLNDSLVNQILTMMNPEGLFMKLLSEPLDKLQINDRMPKEFKDNFFEMDGKPNRKWLDAAKIAAIHFESILSAYPHELNRKELEKYDIHPELNNDLTPFEEGVIQSAAIQHLASALRRVMGVSQNNQASERQFDSFFMPLAVEVASAMKKSGLIYEKKVQVIDTNREPSEVSILVASEDYQGIFRPKASIILSLLDPTLKNSWSTTPLSAKVTVARTSIPVTKQQEQTIKNENQKASKLNLPFISALAALGGEEGIATLKQGLLPNETNRLLFNIKDYVSKKGQVISDRLAFDKLFEIGSANLDSDWSDLNLYNSNVALKNGRTMQEGAATQQNNKLTRQIEVNLTSLSNDLTGPKLLDTWKWVLAHNLGVSTSKGQVNLEQVDKALQFVEKALDPDNKFNKVLNTLVQTSAKDILQKKNGAEQKANQNDLLEFIQAFNKENDDLKIDNFDMGLNALVEMIRYVKASDADRKNFRSYITCEIDGINDGPANINMMYGMIMGPFTEQKIRNAFRTGNYLGLRTKSQDVMTPDTLASKVTGTQGEDLHAEVAGRKAVEAFLRRVIKANEERSLRDTAENFAVRSQAEIQIRLTRALFNLLKNLGWIEDIDSNFKLEDLKELPKEAPFKFVRDVSKKLTTIIPYGSEIKGSTTQLTDLVLSEIYTKISNLLQKIAIDQATTSEKLQVRTALASLEELMKYRYLNDQGFVKSTASIEDLTTAFTKDIPSKKYLQDQSWQPQRGTNFLIKGKDKESIRQDIRNFSLTMEGFEQLRDVLISLLGAPAQYAVNEALGHDGMKGSQVITTLGYLINTLAQGAEAKERELAKGDLANLTGNKLYQAQERIRSVAPNFRFASGAQAIINKTEFQDQDPIYENPETKIVAYPSRGIRASAGVSAGPLVTQAVGDASMVQYASSELQKANINTLQVFDGIYSDISSILQAGEILNKASNHAQQQRIFNTMYRKIISVGKNLKNQGWTKKDDPFEAFVDCLSNLAVGYSIDGKSSKQSLDFQGNVYNLLEKLSQDNAFEPSLFNLRESYRKQKQDRKLSPQAQKMKMEDAVNDFISQIKALKVNEDLQKEVLNKLPKTIHHMSGVESNFVDGSSLSLEEANTLLREVNSLQRIPFKSFADLLSAYMNRLVDDSFESYAKEQKLTAKDIQNWKQFTKRDKGNTGYRSIEDERSFALINDRIQLKQSRGELNQNQYSGSKVFNTSSIDKAVRLFAKQSGQENLLTAIYRKAVKSLPKDTKLTLVGSIGALPKEVQGQFANKQQVGLFTVKDGIPYIYIVDKGTKLDLYDPKNMETLFHEVLHVPFATTIHQFKEDPAKLIPEQRQALENLEALLNDFMDTNAWNEEIVPESLTRLRQILSEIKDPAERLDESLAYILTNRRIYEDLQKYHLKNAETHSKRFGQLIGRLVKAAVNTWKKILNIITGSPLDSAMDSDSQLSLFKMKPMDFLGLYGANTLVLLEAEPQVTPRTRREQLKRLEGTTRAAVYDPFFMRADFKNIQNYLASVVRVNEQFKLFVKKGVNATKERLDLIADEKAKENYQKYLNLRNSFKNYAKSFTSYSDKFSDLALGLMRRDLVEPSQRSLLHTAIRSLQQTIKDPHSLVQDPNTATQEDLKKSEEIFNLLQGESQFLDFEHLDLPEGLVPKNLSDAFVMAWVMVDPEVNKALGKIQFSPIEKVKFQLEDPSKAFEDIAKQWDETLKRKELNDKFLGETTRVIYEEQERYLAQQDKTPPKLNKLDEKFQKIDRGVASAVANALSFVFPTVSSRIKENSISLTKAPLFSYSFAMEGIRKIANQKIKNATLADFIREIYGRTPSRTPLETMLKKIKGFYDKVRMDYLDELPKFLTSQFKRTDVDVKLRSFFYRTLANTHIIALNQDEIKKVLSNPQELPLLVREIEDQLAEDSPRYVNEYKRKTKELADYESGIANAGKNLLRNAISIAYLNGEPSRLNHVETQTISLIDKLRTLYMLQNLSKGDLKRLKKLYKDEPEAMASILEHLRSVEHDEELKVQHTGDQTYLFNFKSGALPKGDFPSGDYRLVPKRLEKDYIRQGYKTLGVYAKSDIDPSETVLRMYCKTPLEQSYQEGAFQSINQTSFGWNVNRQSNNEAIGAKVTDTKHVRKIYDNYPMASKGLNLIPIYDIKGYIVGYERSIPMEDRWYLLQDTDLFTGLAQQMVRQRREIMADSINADVIQLAWQQYDQATPYEKAHEFVDLMHSKDQTIQRGIARLPYKTLEHIRKTFGGDHLYVRADEVNTYLGHDRMSVTDIWNNRFILPKKAEDMIVKCIEAVFGDTAQYWIGRGERIAMSAVSFVRDTIVIRSGVVAFANALANTLLLNLALGMSFNDIYKYFKETWRDTYKYSRLDKLKREYEFKEAETSDKALKEKYRKKTKEIDADISALPIYRLLREGEFSTISAEGIIFDDVDLMKNNINDYINGKIQELPGGEKAKKVLSNALMLKGTSTYQLMAEFINMGDWMAKVAAYRYQTEKLNMNHDMARNNASILFVDYDQPVSREREWINRMGLTWFMTYKWRMIPAALFCLMTNPSRIILGTLLEGQLPVHTGTPLTENLITKVLNGGVEYSVGLGSMLRGLMLHPLAVLTGVSR